MTEQAHLAADEWRATGLPHRRVPPQAVAVPGMDLSGRFRAGGDGAHAGSGLLDVSEMAPNQWGLLVGDAAAADPDVIREAVHAAAASSTAPADVLHLANAALSGTRPRVSASLVLARLELDLCGAWATVACAGEPRAMVVRRAGWIDVRGQPGNPLGVIDGLDVADDRVGLGPGDALVIYSDGVAEARDRFGEAFSSERLPATLLEHTRDDADGLADCLVRGAVRHAGGAVADDVAVLAVRVPEDAADDPHGRLRGAFGATGEVPLPGYPVGEPYWGHRSRPAPPREARIKLPPEETAVRTARRFVEGVLHSWRMSSLAGGDAELITSELVTNAVLHTGTTYTVMMNYDGERVRIGVGDGSRVIPDPEPRYGDADGLGGRGLLLVEALAADWGVSETVEGKRVWAEIAVPPPEAPPAP